MPSAVRLLRSSDGTEIATLLPHQRELVSWLAFSADASMLAVACAEGNIHVWRLDLIADQLEEWRIVPAAESLSEFVPATAEPVGSEAIAGERRDTVAEGYPAAFSQEPAPVIQWYPDSQAQAHQWNEAVLACDERIRKTPDVPLAHAERGHTLAKQAEWREAAASLAEAIQRGDERPVVWFHLAIVHLVRRRLDGYATVCADMVDRFADTADAANANLVVWTCVLGPAGLRDDARPLQIAERSLASGEAYWSVLRHGALLYRAGQYAAAEKQLLRAGELAAEENWLPEQAFLAMLYARQGDAAQAAACLARAEGGRDGAQHELTWVERAQLAVLCAEARTLIGSVKDKAAAAGQPASE